MDKKVLAGIVGLAVLVVGVSFLDKPAQVTVNVPDTPVNVNNNIPEGQFGSIPGNEIQSEEVIVGGVKTTYRKKYLETSNQLGTASTTPCSLLSPSATSTLISYSLDIASSTAVAASFDVSTSTTRYASSSPAFIWAKSIAASRKASVIWQAGQVGTTSAQVVGTTLGNNIWGYNSRNITGENPIIIAPDSWVNLNVKIAASDSGPNWGGACVAVFRDLKIY